METDSTLTKSLTQVKDRALQAAAHAKDVSRDTACGLAREVDGNARRYPWAYVAGAAVAALLAGYLLGRMRK